ncbi:MAG: BamA/TamA family outer membrane protein [Bacteroidales bacterium]|nr:BamA/TamA family outer membrane protein [Bacteroidales bacterium]
MRFRSNIGLAVLLLILGGCSNIRFLAEDQVLYTGQTGIDIRIGDDDVKPSDVKQIVKSVPAQKPNNSLFDRRLLPPVGLWVYNYCKDEEQRKLKHWIYKSVSKAPVLISDIRPELRAQKMANDLFDQGYFGARAWPVVDTIARNPRKARISYFIEVDTPYRYAKIDFDPAFTSMDTTIKQDDFRTQIKPGDPFNLDKLSRARNDLSRQFQNQGYFYFARDFIQLDADTSLGNKEINLLVRSRGDLPASALSKYSIDSILVIVRSPGDSAESVVEAFQYEGLTIFSSGDYLKPEVLRAALFFNSGDPYSYTSYQNSLTRLNKLGVFSFVRIHYEKNSRDSLSHLLNVKIDLILAEPVNLNIAADMAMKSTGFVGPALSAGISHSNTFRGAEKVQFSPTGALEWQWGPKQENQLGTFSYELGLNSGITFPKLTLLGNHQRIKALMNQETSVNLNFNLRNRTNYYSMFSALTNLKYSWGKRREIRHTYAPVYLNSVSLLATTPAFDSVIDGNIYIRKSFEEQLIIGMRYDFSYDNTYKKQAHNLFYQAGVSSSGNALDLFEGIGRGASDRPFEILNTVYSQHLKLTSDFRYYLNGFQKTLAMRLYAGIGIPYGNSSVLPYVEQFFSGGAYSIRGFTARTLGPGSYHEVENSYIDQSGDMKLEANLEFRFGISRILKGAVFLESGNIWLINEDENRPGSRFHVDSFNKQLAVGCGVGLRFDFNFFVLRTDLGFPLRTPYLQDDKYWFSGEGSTLSSALFYFAIGYPF